jgi:hypothetical protein
MTRTPCSASPPFLCQLTCKLGFAILQCPDTHFVGAVPLYCSAVSWNFSKADDACVTGVDSDVRPLPTYLLIDANCCTDGLPSAFGFSAKHPGEGEPRLSLGNYLFASEGSKAIPSLRALPVQL